MLSVASQHIVNDKYLSYQSDALDAFSQTPYTILEGEESITESNGNEEGSSSDDLDRSFEKSKLKVLFDDVLTNPSCIGSNLVGGLFVACDVAYISLMPV